jgi:hypothetical protein
MIVLLLIIATSFLTVYFSQSLPMPLKFVCYVFLAIALLLLIVPLAPIRAGPIW